MRLACKQKGGGIAAIVGVRRVSAQNDRIQACSLLGGSPSLANMRRCLAAVASAKLLIANFLAKSLDDH